MKKFLSTLAVAGLATVVLASCSGKQEGNDKTDDTPTVDNTTQTLANGDIYMSDEVIASVNDALAGDYNIRVWVSEVEGVAAATEKQIAEFGKKFDKIKLTAVVDGVGEGSAAGQMATDVESGADVYCFAQDQLARLVQAEALAPVSNEVKARLTANNDKGSVAASSVAGKMYAYPLTSDNGYFMYYDKSVVDEAHLGDVMAIMDDCKAAGKKFAFNIVGTGWYTASLFFGAGCHSSWTTNQAGFFTSVDDDFNSDKGLLAAKALHEITNHEAFLDKSEAATFDAAIPSAVVISGTWDSAVAKEKLGENFGAAELPSVTVDGTKFHLGSFSGNKLMGVKPQNGNPNKQAVCQLLAEYLTLGDQQLARFDEFGWGPSNVNAQKNEKIQNDPVLKAFAAQSAYATPQGQVNGAWWDIASALAKDIKDAADEAAMKAALKKYEDDIKAKVALSAQDQGTWAAIGEAVGDWNTDIVVVVPGENGLTPAGTYTIKEDGEDRVFDLVEGKEFKLRQGFGWNAQCNTVKEGCTYAEKAGSNIKVLVSGKYKIEVEINDKNEAVSVNLVPVTE